MKRQRIIGFLVAGIVLAVLTVWLTRPREETPPQTPARAGSRLTNTVASRSGARTNTPALRTSTSATLAAKAAPSANPVRPIAARGTNVAPAAARGTNAPVAASSALDKAQQLLGKVRKITGDDAFYPVVVGGPLVLAIVFLILAARAQKKKDAAAAASGAVARLRRQSTKAVQSCNVLEVRPAEDKVWHFASRSGGFVLSREQTSPEGQTLPQGLVRKQWSELWQRKLNIAWVPSEHVFLRIVHLPQSGFDDTAAMVELQLEKLSPMPVAQICWSLQILPHREPQTQTVLVVIVARTVVEEFLGKLEGKGFMADRLEVPMLDELQATATAGDGVWLYPAKGGNRNSMLVAWRYGEVLQSLGFVALGTTGRAAALHEQLLQMAWSGEMEGWLNSPPRWRLVADGATLQEWEPIVREALEDVEVVTPVQETELARLTASRAAQAEEQGNLLPLEHLTRYHQQFVDRLWMRALGGAVVLYCAIVAIYLIALQVALYRTRGIEDQVAGRGPAYTNAMQLKAQYEVLKDRQELKFAALDCWRAVAELLPEEVMLEGYNFSDGRRLSLQGTAPKELVQQLYQFEAALRKTVVNGQRMFDPEKGEGLSYHPAPGGNNLGWSFTLELKRSEMQ